MELTDGIRSVVQVRSRLPSLISFGPSLPMNEVLHSLALVARVNDVLHLVFLFAILHDIGGTWGSHRLTRQAFAIWLDVGNVDDRMDVHRAWKTEFDGVCPDQLCDGIGTKPSFQQLPRSAGKTEVISGKPDLIPDSICWGIRV